jgi:hypothetical protein
MSRDVSCEHCGEMPQGNGVNVATGKVYNGRRTSCRYCGKKLCSYCFRVTSCTTPDSSHSR